MKVTTQDLIKMLPFDNEFKEQMLSKWDTFSEDQRFNLEQIIWDTYTDLYDIRLDTNTEVALRELAEGKESMDTAFASRVREKTDKEFEEMFQQNVPVANLVEAREKLQEIMDTTLVKNNSAPVEENKDTSTQS